MTTSPRKIDARTKEIAVEQPEQELEARTSQPLGSVYTNQPNNARSKRTPSGHPRHPKGARDLR
jgi:hypothetical protein